MDIVAEFVFILQMQCFYHNIKDTFNRHQLLEFMPDLLAFILGFIVVVHLFDRMQNCIIVGLFAFVILCLVSFVPSHFQSDKINFICHCVSIIQ